jgi:hypothetical protein
LIAGGAFTLAGGVPCHYIARWNGSVWQALGTELGWDVYALTVYNGDLIAGGAFWDGSSLCLVARWDGTSWQPLGYGIPAEGGRVNALAAYNGGLIAGGSLAIDGGDNVGIKRWNGTTWTNLGTGVGGTYPEVCALTVYNGDLIAGGRFATAGGVTCNSIARWDGSAWSPLGSGLTGGSGGPAVYSLTVYKGDLIAGGRFWDAGGVQCRFIARWDGSTWYPMGSGLESPGPVANPAYALTTYRGSLMVGGSFMESGPYVAHNIARWGCPPCIGDLNCDGVIDFGDINAFVLYLSNYDVWWNTFLDCDPLSGDINSDGTYGQNSFTDINPFVELMISGQGPCP